MHHLAIKRTTKNEAHLSPNTHVTAFVRPPVGTVPFGATADTCAETDECRLQCMCRGVRTANLHAVRSAITATAELLVLLFDNVCCWLSAVLQCWLFVMICVTFCVYDGAATHNVSNFWSEDKNVVDAYLCNATETLYSSDSGAAEPLIKLTVSDMKLEAFQNTTTAEFSKNHGLWLEFTFMKLKDWQMTNCCQ